MQDNSSKNLVTARGTSDGLVIRLKSEVGQQELISAIKDYISTRKSFLSGNQVVLDWSDGIPDEAMNTAVAECLRSEFDIKVKDQPTFSGGGSELEVSRVSNSFEPTRGSSSDQDYNSSDSGLFGGLNNISEVQEEAPEPKVNQSSSNLTNSMFWDNPDAMIVNATMRSGQRIETENSIVLIGDVNCGAEIVAAGDVIVLGTLRGVVHAGAYDESGGGRFIFSLDLRPTQLRIGSIISRGAEKPNTSPTGEIAYVDGNSIVVEKYNARNAANRLK